MKKYIFCYLLFSFPLITILNAQTTQHEHFEHIANQCFSQNDYSSESEVVAQYVLKNMGFALCSGSCPYPLKSCVPVLLNQATVVTTDNANSLYCINGVMKFKWKCTPSVPPVTYGGGVVVFGDVSTGDNTGVDVGGGDPVGGGFITPSEIVRPAEIKAFPNPTNGPGQLQIHFLQKGNLQIGITNVAGQVIEQKSYIDMPKGIHQLPFDLTKYGSGIYYFSIRINDQFIQTLRLIVI